MSLAHRIADGCRSLIRSWNAVDRIRVSPTAGRLLGLQGGQTVLICGELVQVRSRTVRTCEHETSIEYILEHNGGECALTVFLADIAGRTSGQVAFGDRSVHVFDDDIAVLASER